jgi:hypothetical protein
MRVWFGIFVLNKVKNYIKHTKNYKCHTKTSLYDKVSINANTRMG